MMTSVNEIGINVFNRVIFYIGHRLQCCAQLSFIPYWDKAVWIVPYIRWERMLHNIGTVFLLMKIANAENYISMSQEYILFHPCWTWMESSQFTEQDETPTQYAIRILCVVKVAVSRCLEWLVPDPLISPPLIFWLNAHLQAILYQEQIENILHMI